MITQKIIPHLWFKTSDGKIKEVLEYYENIFRESFSFGKLTSYGETPSGYTEAIEVDIFGQSFLFLSTKNEHHAFNDSVFIYY